MTTRSPGRGVTWNGAASAGSIISATVTVHVALVADTVLEPLETVLLSVAPGAEYKVTGGPAGHGERVNTVREIPRAPTQAAFLRAMPSRSPL